MKQITVVGGSIAGLITALALARDGHRVTILEKDAAPLPDSPEEAFSSWGRRSAPQILQSHAFLGRMYREIRDREPDLLRQLLELGAEELTFDAQARQYFEDLQPEAGDDDIVLLACRRVTFEWALRRHVIETGLVTFRDGAEVTGLVARPGAASAQPVVIGVQLRSGEPAAEAIACDLVVDASGRRTRLASWLRAIGAGPLREESQPCGIFYSSRFYRLNPGVSRPNEDGIIGGDLGYLKFGIFPADGGTFSVTLAAAPDDDPMRAVLRTRGFDAVVAALPSVWQWVDPGVSKPISDVQGMANLRNTRRYLVRDDEPLALGIVAVGDSLVHANPITGRGCSLSWISAYALAKAVQRHPEDLCAMALDFEAYVERDLAPWLRAQLRQDADALEVNAAHRRGEDPFRVEKPEGGTDAKAYVRALFRDGLLPAARENAGLLRRLMRVGHMLEPPEDLMKEPEVVQSALAAYERRHERAPRVTGPSRDEMLALLSAS